MEGVHLRECEESVVDIVRVFYLDVFSVFHVPFFLVRLSRY